MTIEAGTRIGKYEIQSLLGAGGMGEVYRAFDTELRRPVALKFLSPEFIADERRMSRFIQEARAISALNHPNILTVHDIGQADGARFFATELVEGVTLRRHTTARRLKLVEVLDIATQIASALVAAHAAGIVHRDLKPENVMLRKDGYVKVLDFGLAKLTERASSVDMEAETALVNTDPGVVMGTVAYMSPEQASGKEVDARTDIWSLGALLYEMVTGRVPFEGATSSHAIVSILEKEPAPMSAHVEGVPEALELIVTDALTKDREERTQTARELLKKLQRLKQRVDAEAEIERSAPPYIPAGTTNTGAQSTFGTTGRTTAPSGETGTGATQISSAEYVVKQIKGHKGTALLVLALIALVGVGVGFAVYKLSRRDKPAGAMKITPLTSGGRVGGASVRGSTSISTDGRYVVYSALEAGQVALYVRQVATGSNVQIVPPAEGDFLGTTFSPDGEFVYYVAEREKDSPFPALYRIPVLGGTPVKVLERVFSPVSFSPDGKRIAFVRFYPEEGENSLVAENVDGSGEQKLATRRPPEFFSSDGPAWSPDGRVIVCGVRSTASSTPASVVEVPAGGGAERPVTSHQWGFVNRVVWLSDGSGLVLSASPELTSQSTQLWHLAYPSGEVRRITNDLNGYGTYSLGLTADNNTLVTILEDQTTQVWVTAPNEDESRARKITDGKHEGLWGLAWTPDGKIVYHTQVGDSTGFWRMNADGTGAKQLTADAFAKQDVVVSPDGRYLVFQYNRARTWSLWRTDADGGNPVQLTDGDDGLPTFSPDGRWVIFTSARSGKWTLWKVGIDGGTPAQVMDRSSGEASVSPDGKLIAHFYLDEQANGLRKLALIPFEGGQPVKSFELPPGASGSLRWTPDARAVLYVDTRNNVSNVWSQPVEGGPARQLTNFKSLIIRTYDLSRDGKQLALARGNVTFDVVLIKDFR